MRPFIFEVLDFTLPSIADQELETQVDTRVGQLVRQLNSTTSPKGSSRGVLTVHFFEKKRRKAGSGLGWFGAAKGEEDVVWEKWNLEVTLATPRTEDGQMGHSTISSLKRADPSHRAHKTDESHWIIFTKNHHENCYHRQP